MRIIVHYAIVIKESKEQVSVEKMDNYRIAIFGIAITTYVDLLRVNQVNSKEKLQKNTKTMITIAFAKFEWQ